MRLRHFWRLTSILAVITLIGALGQTVIADEQSSQDDATAAAIVNHSGSAIYSRMISQTLDTSTSSPTFVTLVGTTIQSTAPSSLFRATFSGESACYGGNTGGDYCRLKIVIDGVEMNPGVGDTFAFDSTNDARETINSWESHAIQRFSNCVPAGDHFIAVQYSVNDRAPAGPPIVFRLDDWVLTVDRLSSCT